MYHKRSLPFLIVAVLVLLFSAGVNTAHSQGGGPWCGDLSTSLRVAPNQMTLDGEVANGVGDYPIHVDWGDGSYVDLQTANGSFSTTHDYAYNPGSVLVRTILVTVLGSDGDTSSCAIDFAIDDRPDPSEPWCGNLSASVRVLPNQMTLNGHVLSGVGDYPIHVDWGDGSTVDLQVADGQFSVPHDFAYNPGGVLVKTAEVTVTGSDEQTDVCQLDIFLDDTNQQVGMDLDGYCAIGGGEAITIGPYARDWACRNAFGIHQYVNMEEVCVWQDDGSHPYAGLSDPDEPDSWSCNTVQQPPWPEGQQSPLPLSLNAFGSLDEPMDPPPACPGGTGPEGLVAGDYPPQKLSQDQRQWLYEAFSYSGTAPVGYGGERCGESYDSSDDNFRAFVCQRGHVGPGGIVPGDYDPQTLTQEQRQFLFEEFGNDGTAPVGYGGERCPGQDTYTVDDIHTMEVCASGAIGPYEIEPGSYNPQDLSPAERQWLWDIFGEGPGQEAPVGYGGQMCPSQSQNYPAPDRSTPPGIEPDGPVANFCPAVASFLSVGDIAVVSVSSLNVRSDPSMTAPIQTTSSYGTQVSVISGPSCANGLYWWQIGTGGQGGFAAEANIDGTSLLIPNGSPLPPDGEEVAGAEYVISSQLPEPPPAPPPPESRPSPPPEVGRFCLDNGDGTVTCQAIGVIHQPSDDDDPFIGVVELPGDLPEGELNTMKVVFLERGSHFDPYGYGNCGGVPGNIFVDDSTGMEITAMPNFQLVQVCVHGIENVRSEGHEIRLDGWRWYITYNKPSP